MATRTRTRPGGSTRPRGAPPSVTVERGRPDAAALARRDAARRARAEKSDQADEYAAAREAADQTGQQQPPDPPAGEPADRATGAPAGGRNPRGARRATGGRIARGERMFDSAARDAGRLSLLPPRRLTARDGSGFLFGLLLYVLGLNYVRHGPDGVKGWLSAKFLNKPWTPPDDSPADHRIKRHDPADSVKTGDGGTARAPAAPAGRKP